MLHPREPNKYKGWEAGGVVGCPAEAVEIVKTFADFVAPHNGGDGAVRDFIEWLLNTPCHLPERSCYYAFGQTILIYLCISHLPN